MSQLIEFLPEESWAETYGLKPVPASECIPEWYKKAQPNLEGQSPTPGLYGNHPTPSPNTTYKACSPFMDTFLTGYIWQAPLDIEVKLVGDDHVFRWRRNEVFVTDHAPEQAPGMPQPVDGDSTSIFKWMFPFVIKTPPGYSTLFTHPLNRADLPFRTFSGIVDTDTYPMATQFPFQPIMKSKESMIIERGTPLCQFIPIKREAWQSEVRPFDEVRAARSAFEWAGKIVRSYKRQYWSRKEYR